MGRPKLPRPVCAFPGCEEPVKDLRQRYCGKRHSNMARARPLYERLDEICVPGEPGHCWEYPGARDPDGYGVVSAQSDGSGRKQKQLRVARVAYERRHGPVPPGKLVMHTCDNPPCWNPDHLKVGSVLENNEDKARKLRASSKLTADQVRQIRNLLDYGMPYAEIGRRFGVSDVAVWNIRHRRTWKHVE